MRSARDTFLHYLSDNLSGLVVNPVRRDSKNPNLSKPKIGAINVNFFNDLLSPHICRLQVSIDALYADEFDAIDAAQRVVKLLQSSAYTPKLDYTDPETPVPTGTNLYWNPYTITFRQVSSDLYFHYCCTLTISHHNN